MVDYRVQRRRLHKARFYCLVARAHGNPLLARLQANIKAPDDEQGDQIDPKSENS